MKNYTHITIIIILIFIILFIGYELMNNKNNVKLNKIELNQISEEGDSLLKSKKYDEAILKYEILLKNGTVNPIILNNLFESYVYVGDFDKALGIIRLLANLIGNDGIMTGPIIKKDNISENINKLIVKINETNQEDPNILLEYAKLLYKAGDYYYELNKKEYYLPIMTHYLSAYVVLDKAIELDSKNGDYYFYQGWLLMDIGNRFDLSEEKLKKAVSLKQDDFRYYYRLGNAYMHQNKYNLAKEEFLKGIALNDNYEKLHLNLGNMYFKLGENKKGYKSYEEGLKICQTHCDAFNFNIGNQKYIEGKLDESLDYYYKTIKVNPNHMEAKKNISILKKKLGLN